MYTDNRYYISHNMVLITILALTFATNRLSINSAKTILYLKKQKMIT